MSLPRRALPDGLRRGWCPGLARPMPTGDGLLARVHPPLGRLDLAQVRAVADAARRFGNGHVDITARANLQIRGVRADTVEPLAAALGAVGLGDARGDGGPQRLTLTSPLAGLAPDPAPDPAHAVAALAGAIERAGRAIPGLPPKTLVAVIGAGLDATGADLALTPTRDRVLIRLAEASDVRVLAPGEAAAAVASLLRAFTATGRRRMRDLTPAERESVCAHLPPGAACEPAVPVQGTPLPPGLSRAGPYWIVTAAAPFGRCTADAVSALAGIAAELGAAEVRLTPERGVVLAGTAPDPARVALAALARAGFLVRPDDPRRAVAACPGAPACAAGTTPVPEHAARLAEAFAGFAALGRVAHVSGCAKGCAHPAPADLTLVGDAGGYRVVPGGSAGAAMADAAGPRLTFEAALKRVREADPARPLARAFDGSAAPAS